EPKPSAAEALRGRPISLAELFEQLSLLLWSHANTGVSDREFDPVASVGHLACRKLDLARFGELASVARQVEQYLPQPHAVHGQSADVPLGINDEAVLVLLGKLPGGADDVVDQRCQLHGLWVELELSGLDLRQIEHLIDEAEQVGAGAMHALKWLLRLFCS